MTTGRQLTRRLRPIFDAVVNALTAMPEWVSIGGFAICRYTPGLIGIGLRYVFAARLLGDCGQNVRIGPGCTIENWQRISVGNNVSIHTGSYLDGLGGLRIGNDVSIAHRTSLLAFDHTWSDVRVPIKYNPLKPIPIAIDNDVWIGCGVIILGGTTISSRSVVGAGAVLPNGAYPSGLHLGVPATTRPLPQ